MIITIIKAITIGRSLYGERNRGRGRRRRRLEFSKKASDQWRNSPPFSRYVAVRGLLYHESRSRLEEAKKRKRRIEMTAVGSQRTRRRRRKTSSLKLKEAKIGILLPKLSVVPPGAVSNTKPIAFYLAPTHLFVSLLLINSWMFIRKLRGRLSTGRNSTLLREATRSTDANLMIQWLIRS